MLSNAIFLILDEPTNHLDITSKEILENAINSYEGTILYVSHDRYFINKTATRIIELTNNKIVNYIGNYDYYLEKKDELTAIYASPSTNSISAANSAETVPKAETVSKVDWQTQKEEQAKFRKRQNEFKKTEDKIFELEDTLSSINEKMADPDIASDSVILMELTKECDSINLELEKLYEKWEELSNDI
jgi:ATP-binding cassette subfamily F protein 3